MRLYHPDDTPAEIVRRTAELISTSKELIRRAQAVRDARRYAACLQAEWLQVTARARITAS